LIYARVYRKWFLKQFFGFLFGSLFAGGNGRRLSDGLGGPLLRHHRDA